MTNALRILLVDDEPSILALFRVMLSDAGYGVYTAPNAQDAMLLMGTGPFDLLIADLRLEGPSGLNLIEVFKGVQPDCALIMISANPTREQIIEAFRADVDDFLIKPISGAQMLQAVGRAILRHHTRHEPVNYPTGETISYGALTLQPQQHTAIWHDEALSLTPTEFCILLTLVQHGGQSVSARLLIKRCRGFDEPEPKARLLLKPHIANLREKLEQNGRFPRVLINHRKMGLLIHATD